MSALNTMWCDVDPSKDDVMIVDFANGQLRHTSNQESAIKFGCYKNEKRKRVMPMAETAQMTYYPDVLSSRKFCKYMVGVRDKKTNTVQIHSAAIYKLKPKTDVDGGIEVDQNDSAELTFYVDGGIEVDQNDSAELTFMQKNDMLTMAFGSSKKKKSVTSRLNNAIQGEALHKAVSVTVEHALSFTSNEAEDVKPKEDISVLPKCNVNATVPHEAYMLADIISQASMESLEGLAQEVTTPNKTSIDSITKSKYVLDHMQVLPVQEKSKRHRVKCLLYLAYMLEMYHFKSADLRRKESFSSDIPDEVKRTLMNTFSQKIQQVKGFSRCMPARLKDKLAAHIIVLMLIIDEFDLSVDDVQTSLKMGQQRFMTIVKCLGCHIYKNTSGLSDSRRIGLKCPVEFPQQTPAKGKGRK